MNWRAVFIGAALAAIVALEAHQSFHIDTVMEIQAQNIAATAAAVNATQANSQRIDENKAANSALLEELRAMSATLVEIRDQLQR